ELLPPAADVKREPVDVDGVSAEWITVPNSSEAITVLYLHGGGFVIGSVNIYVDLVSRIARASGARALSVDYRLAPEHPFPAALDDATTAYRWLLKQGVAPESIVIAGDSAGGALTASTLLALKAAGDPLPGGAVLLSPGTDFTFSGETMETRKDRDPLLTRSLCEHWLGMYLGVTSPTVASPLFGDYNGLPPILIQVGDAEILLDHSTRYAERAKAAGVDVTLEIWDDMIHVFQLFAPMLPEGQQAIDKIGAWVKQHVHSKAAA
ncbi:MAG: alpha/beta hydrolase, partial [Chloroflexota bacterium]|nr:alpha/beta hydrolase [Chloroflexota bacterium]